MNSANSHKPSEDTSLIYVLPITVKCLPAMLTLSRCEQWLQTSYRCTDTAIGSKRECALTRDAAAHLFSYCWLLSQPLDLGLLRLNGILQCLYGILLLLICSAQLLNGILLLSQ